jgi:hypothetical protein
MRVVILGSEKTQNDVVRAADRPRLIFFILNIQGGSDKSGILKTVLQNHTAQLKSIRFY